MDYEILKTRIEHELQNMAQTHAGPITIVMLLAAVKLAIAFVLGVGT